MRRQAQNEAIVRFGPQRFALRELLMQAVQTRNMALRAAAGADRGIQAALTAARGETKANYGDAIKAGQGTTDMVRSSLAGLGGAAAPFAAAFEREGGLGVGRMQSSETGALQSLTQRRLESASGRAYASQAAQDQFRADTSKIGRSYQELAGEQGAFESGRVGELRKEQADRQFQRDLAEFTQGQQNKRNRTTARTQRRGQDLSHADRQEANRIARDKAKRDRRSTANRPRHGVGSLTQGEETKDKDFIGQVFSVIKNPPAFEDPPKGAKPGEKGPRLTHERMVSHLRSGTNPLGKPIPDSIIEIAYDLKRNGGKLSARGIRLMHSRGLHVPPEWIPRRTGRGKGGPYGTGRMEN